MRKVFILLLAVTYILYSSGEKLNKKKKSMDAAGGHIYPGDIIESVHSDIPGDPQIKIQFAGTDDDDDEATITIDHENEEEEDEDRPPIKKKKLPKSKTEDIHSFL